MNNQQKGRPSVKVKKKMKKSVLVRGYVVCGQNGSKRGEGRMGSRSVKVSSVEHPS
jgi:hypothetical protein